MTEALSHAATKDELRWKDLDQNGMQAELSAWQGLGYFHCFLKS